MIFLSYQKNHPLELHGRIKLKNYSFKIREVSLPIFIVYFSSIIFSHRTEGQVLLANTQANQKTLNHIKRILSEKLLIPHSIIEESPRRNCKVISGDEKYDLVVCIKKNGELTFPIYKQAILKNSYQTFLN